MRVLLTGGAGFIGSHCAVELLNANYEVVIVDNLDNSSEDTIKNIEKIANNKKCQFYLCDLRSKEQLSLVFEKSGPFDGVIHFAGLKAVGESVAKPLEYYDCNVTGTITLLNIMRLYKCYNIIFSSSATVYGDHEVPMSELTPTTTANPYARTKRFIEQILEDTCYSEDGDKFQVVILRYFNPCGAHPSGLIGEDPLGIPNNLVPYLQRVISGKLPHLNVFGTDYDTPDGTGVRDYIHVVDLAVGHVAALNACFHNRQALKTRYEIFNLGCGKGCSVLEVVKALEKASGREIKIKKVDRRPGDIAECYSDPTKANKLLNWKAKYNLDDICRDVCNFLEKCGYLK